jgi:hypothetical protein
MYLHSSARTLTCIHNIICLSLYRSFYGLRASHALLRGIDDIKSVDLGGGRMYGKTCVVTGANRCTRRPRARVVLVRGYTHSATVINMHARNVSLSSTLYACMLGDSIRDQTCALFAACWTKTCFKMHAMIFSWMCA